MRIGIWALAVVVGLCAGAAKAQTQVERGAYLARGIMACGNCHTPKGPGGVPVAGREMAGGFVINAPEFTVTVPNITPDKATGIGAWSDDEIINAIRNGRRPDGRLMGPPMSFEFYRKMSDADVRAVVAFLRSVPPIVNKTDVAPVYNIPLPTTYGPTVTRVSAPAISNKIAYGKYLSDMGHCMECHTPMVRGHLDETKLGAGGRVFPAGPPGTLSLSANLTPANPDGMAKWTDQQVKDAIQKGVRPDGHKLAPPTAYGWYASINGRDMDALVAYLRTLKPAQP